MAVIATHHNPETRSSRETSGRNTDVYCITFTPNTQDGAAAGDRTSETKWRCTSKHTRHSEQDKERVSSVFSM